jgi:cytochrome c biogenesis protein CcmG, thiol:disulfide interchange protein DsbE
MKRSPVPVVAVAAAAALIALLAYGLISKQTDDSIDKKIASGQRVSAPDRTLPRVGSQAEGSLASYRGKVVVLNFWASWCVPCKKEAKILERQHHAMASQGGTVLGVTYNDTDPDAQRFMRENGMTFPSLRDVGGKLYRSYGSTGVPETFVIDRAGRITAVHRGQLTDDGWLVEHVEPLLGERV